ncbi:MAG: chromate reductase [Paracoccaceae bacterium]
MNTSSINANGIYQVVFMSDLILLGLPGSLRQGATNRKLLHEAARLFGPATYVEADLRLPLYDGDDEVATGIPAAVQTLADQVTAADAVVISTPE